MVRRRATLSLLLTPWPICEISATHTTPKLFKVLPLTKANLTKLAAAIATGIFTTVVRQSLPNY